MERCSSTLDPPTMSWLTWECTMFLDLRMSPTPFLFLSHWLSSGAASEEEPPCRHSSTSSSSSNPKQSSGGKCIKIGYPGKLFLSTVETAFIVAICPRGNLLYMRIYFITDLKIIGKCVLRLEFTYFISDFTLHPVTLEAVSTVHVWLIDRLWGNPILLLRK